MTSPKGTSSRPCNLQNASCKIVPEPSPLTSVNVVPTPSPTVPNFAKTRSEDRPQPVPNRPMTLPVETVPVPPPIRGTGDDQGDGSLSVFVNVPTNGDHAHLTH